jgi:catechol 2,3-dioxygenase-like lactoylglutathione lyase family enzyme
MKQTCEHIGFFTMNAEAMKEFYIRVLGFELGNESTLPKSLVENIFGLADDCRFVKLYKGGFMVEIFEPLSSRLHIRMADHAGVNHWGFCVADRASFVENLRGDGLSVIEIDRNGRSVYFLTDPDGNRIEIRECSE